jgi:hypothetical protein
MYHFEDVYHRNIPIFAKTKFLNDLGPDKKGKIGPLYFYRIKGILRSRGEWAVWTRLLFAAPTAGGLFLGLER